MGAPSERAVSSNSSRSAGLSRPFSRVPARLRRALLPGRAGAVIEGVDMSSDGVAAHAPPPVSREAGGARPWPRTRRGGSEALLELLACSPAQSHHAPKVLAR